MNDYRYNFNDKGLQRRMEDVVRMYSKPFPNGKIKLKQPVQKNTALAITSGRIGETLADLLTIYENMDRRGYNTFHWGLIIEDIQDQAGDNIGKLAYKLNILIKQLEREEFEFNVVYYAFYGGADL